MTLMDPDRHELHKTIKNKAGLRIMDMNRAAKLK
jgi:hypothetical protein